MGHLLGYARVSTTDQQPQLQVDALQHAGCYRVFVETASAPAPTAPPSPRSWTSCARRHPGRLETRPAWPLPPTPGRHHHQPGRTRRRVSELQEAIDTTTPGGKLVFHVFAALAEFERDLIRERTAAGLAAARARGRRGGRPAPMAGHKLQVVQEMYRSGQYTVTAIAKTLGVSRASIYRHLTSDNR
jgi:DNA invertase Pin-like site-specific DNA recombinase